MTVLEKLDRTMVPLQPAKKMGSAASAKPTLLRWQLPDKVADGFCNDRVLNDELSEGTLPDRQVVPVTSANVSDCAKLPVYAKSDFPML